jgi:F-type H+-transporting ATPase subunit delta
MASVEKTYADALFSLLADDCEQNSEKDSGKAVFDSVLAQLESIRDIISGTPEFIKLLNTPTVSGEEKLQLVDTVFGGRTSDYVGNFMRLLTIKKRMSYFTKIYAAFRESYNERFGIADITVTSSIPLTEPMRKKITERMSQITGKTVSVTEKVDKSIIGGIMIDYGNTRLDGSVKTRLAELKKDLSGIIA